MRKSLIAGILAVALGVSGLYGQSCPSSCTTITSGPLTFCRCLIYTGGTSDRVQLITDRSVTIVDVDRDGLRDIPFGVWAYGSEGAYVLKQTAGGIPGTFTAVRISSRSTYGITNVGDINGDGVEDFASAGHWRNHSVYLLVSDGAFPSYRDTLIRYHGSGTYDAPNSIIGYGSGVYWSAYDGSINFYDISTHNLLTFDPNICEDGVAAGDFNGDGYVDAACSVRGVNYGLGIYAFLYNGSEFYRVDTITTTGPWQGILAHDMDDDGKADIVGAGRWGSVFYNRDGYWEEIRIDSNLSQGSNPFARVNIADLDCDGDMDIVMATACPPSGNPILAWYEHITPTSWEIHPIDFGGSSCSGTAPYPYGVRVGLLDEAGDTGRADIVIVREARSKIYAYYNITPDISCAPLTEHDDLPVAEEDGGPVWSLKAAARGLRIKAGVPVDVVVYRSDGYVVFRGKVSGERYLPLGAGMYFVKVGREVRKVVVR